jgi:hypothetical protein
MSKDSMWQLLCKIFCLFFYLNTASAENVSLVVGSSERFALLEPCKLFFSTEFRSTVWSLLAIRYCNQTLVARTWTAAPSHRGLATTTSSTAVLIVPWREPAVVVSNHALLFVMPCQYAMQMGPYTAHWDKWQCCYSIYNHFKGYPMFLWKEDEEHDLGWSIWWSLCPPIRPLE